ncbi:MAG: dihydrofolate reductase [Clostridia bacterium]|nr:dihydrofolate reductase [Clostridia bacterium]
MRKDFILLASADHNWGLGKDNKLLKRIPEDMKRFAQLTKGNLIIVGRKTLESFKDKKPLPERVNVVLSRDYDYTCEGALMAHDMDELDKALSSYEGDVYVCGGAAIYELLLPYCNKALITQIDGTFEADTFLTNLDRSPEWHATLVGDWQESQNGTQFRYVDYERIARNTP